MLSEAFRHVLDEANTRFVNLFKPTIFRRHVDDLIIFSTKQSNVSSMKDFIVCAAPELVLSSAVPVNGEVNFPDLP